MRSHVFGLLFLAGMTTAANAQVTERLTILSNGERVGTVVAVTDGPNVSVD